MKITDIKATTVTVPLEAPLRHANGCHWGRFVRTIVEVETDEGITGLGEMGGGGESAEAAFRAMKTLPRRPRPGAARGDALQDRQPHRVALQQPHAGPRRAGVRLPRHPRARSGTCPSTTSSAASSRTACRSRRTCSSATPDADGKGEVRTIDQMVAHAKDLKQKYGFTTHKLKGGVFAPEVELEYYRAIATAVGADKGIGRRATASASIPNGVWSTEQAIRFGQAIEDLNNDYFEDPVFGMNGMRRVREMVRIPTATNTVVVDFEQLAANVLDTRRRRHPARHDLLGRHPPVRQGRRRVRDVPARRRGALSGELGIQLATMLHLGAVIPNLSLRRRRALPPPHRRHHRRREDEVRERRDQGADGPGLGVQARPRQAREVRGAVQEARRLPVRPGPAPARAGRRRSRTTAGPIPNDARVPEIKY